MTDRELKKLSRTDLLELLISESRENERLRDQLAQAEQQLQGRIITVEKAGSIAEASIQLSGVFQAAQNAAAMYLENIQTLSSHQKETCARLETESRREADRRLAEADQKCRNMEVETRRKCQELTTAAEREASAYWDEARTKIEQFCKQREELQELLTQHAGKDTPHEQAESPG